MHVSFDSSGGCRQPKYLLFKCEKIKVLFEVLGCCLFDLTVGQIGLNSSDSKKRSRALARADIIAQYTSSRMAVR